MVLWGRTLRTRGCRRGCSCSDRTQGPVHRQIPSSRPKPTSEEPTACCNATTPGVRGYGVDVDEGSGASTATRNAVWHTNSDPATPNATQSERRPSLQRLTDRRSITTSVPNAARPSAVETTGHSKLFARTCAIVRKGCCLRRARPTPRSPRLRQRPRVPTVRPVVARATGAGRPGRYRPRSPYRRREG